MKFTTTVKAGCHLNIDIVPYVVVDSPPLYSDQLFKTSFAFCQAQFIAFLLQSLIETCRNFQCFHCVADTDMAETHIHHFVQQNMKKLESFIENSIIGHEQRANTATVSKWVDNCSFILAKACNSSTYFPLGL